ncbi:MAG: hypothetical protein PHW64_03300 [Sulfuricurvum sp.]|nr:hypothetical protein [Sulfuricurvum sp.]
MTQELSDTLFLSSIYVGLSLAMIVFIAKANRTIIFGCSVYFLLVGVSVWIAGYKWILIGSIGFMIMAMSYTLWVIYQQSRECIRDIKAMHEEEKRAEHSKNDEHEESTHGQ